MAVNDKLLNTPYLRKSWIKDGSWTLMIPVLAVLWILLSSLSFVPVPWPDDSAFYFPAKDLFSWPPRWVMIPQAPFEPSYREWNFNTMPLFPILIGIARWIGIDGNHALKVIPLGGWALGVLFVLLSLRRAGTSTLLLFVTALTLSFDPILRWSSVLLRPESLIGAMGIGILFGFRFGWPNFLRERKFFHPVSLALLIGAMLHFNAIHLVPVVVILYFREPWKILKIGGLTFLGLIPWFITIFLKPKLFANQMELQFSRLSGFQNPWLSSWSSFTKALLEDMGTPEPWATEFKWGILGALALLPLLIFASVFLFRKLEDRKRRTLLGGAAWLISSIYLWHTKAEVWFTHYIHLAFWSFTFLVAFELEKYFPPKWGSIREAIFFLPSLLPGAIGALFLFGQIAQTIRLESTTTWHWSTYHAWIECIDEILSDEYERLGKPALFRVWDPTFPDITIALSRKHPNWEFTRTNDFWTRSNLAIQHGHEVEAMVVTETYRWDDRTFKGPLSTRPENRSVWMNWNGYFLNQLERDPSFKPRRFLCQKGRWDAFVYLGK